MAITSWNKPSEVPKVCTKVNISIEDENENGFLKTAEVKALLEKRRVYPLSKFTTDINVREIEDVLSRTPFVKTAQCYVTEEGHVCISLTQRTPIIRVKADNEEDYYLDDNGGVMPNSQYTSSMIIVTGNVRKQYACRYLSIVASCIMEDELWFNQIEQINVLPDKTLEIVPRVGDHIVNIGMLPDHSDPAKRKELISEFVKNQLHRLEMFYRHGLSHAGWNKYSYISLEFSNQVICTKKEIEKPKPVVIQPVVQKQETSETTEHPEPGAQKEKKTETTTEKKKKTN